MGYTSYDLNGNIVKQITDVHDSDDEDLEDIFDKNQIPQKLDFKLNNLKHKSKVLV